MGKETGKLIRIWKSTITGELSESQLSADYVPTNQVFDSETRIVYYKLTSMVSVYSARFESQEPKDTKVGFMSPYFGYNGKPCRFVDNQIIEIGV